MLFRPIAACLGAMLVLPLAAVAQDTPRLCVAAAEIESGPVHAMSDFAGGVLIGTDRGLFLGRAAEGKVSLTSAGYPDTGRVLAIHTWPEGTALIGGGNGVFVAREAGGAITFADLLDIDTGRAEHLRDLAGAGVLIGAENGLFLARPTQGSATVVRIDVDSGRVRETFDVPGGGVLAAAEKGLFFARSVADKVSVKPVALVAPLTDTALRPVRSMRSLPGGGVLIEGYVWLLARELDGVLTIALAGDATTGIVDAIGDLPGGGLLTHTEDNKWFVGRAEGGKLTLTPAGDADTGRVFQMMGLRDAMLVQARNGLFVARMQDGKVAVAPAEADTRQVFLMRDVGDGLLISAEKGLFLAHEADGKVTIVPSGTDTGPAQAEGIHRLPSGGTLIGTSRQAWFLARTDGGKLTLTPAGNVDAGRITVIRDFAGSVLIGGEKSLLVVGVAGCAGR